jgi:WD40 repeat protein
MSRLVIRVRTAALLAAALVGGALAPAAEPGRDADRAALYVNDMRQAFQAAQSSDYAKVRELLDRHRPKPGATDLRAWEWYHLQTLCREPAPSFRGHQGRISALAWSPDGKRLASGSADGTAKIWDVAAEKEAAPLAGRPGAGINVLAWSPGGKQLASVGSDALLRGWDAASGKEVFSLGKELHLSNSFASAAWSPDGKRLLWVAGDQMLRVCDAALGKETLAIKAHSGLVFTAAWSPDGRRLASAGTTKLGQTDSEIKVWDASGGQEVLAPAAHPSWVWALAWSPDGKRLASAGEGRAVRLWDTSTGKELDRLGAPTNLADAPAGAAGGFHLTWDAKGQRLSLATRQSFTAWDAATGKLLEMLNGRLSPDGRFLIPPGDGRICDAHTGQLVAPLRPFAAREMLSSFPDGRPALAWSPDGRQIAAGGMDGTVMVWSTTPTAERMLPIGSGTAPAWSPDGRRIVLLDQDMAVKSWDVRTGKQTVLLPGRMSSEVWGVWAPDGRRLATSHPDGTAQVWDMAPGTEPVTLAGRKGSPSLWSPDGKRLATFTNGTVMAWDAATGQQAFLLPAGKLGAGLHLIAWAPDGKRLALVYQPLGPIQVWDVDTAKETLSLDLSRRFVSGLAWSPDGKRLAALSNLAEVIKVWDGGTGKEILSVEQPSRGGTALYPLAWSPDGRLLAVGQMGAGFTVLEVATKKELLAIGGAMQLSAFAWSPDGKRLATLGLWFNKDKNRYEVVKAWEVDTGKESFTLSEGAARRPGGPGDGLSWSPDGRHIASSHRVWDVSTGKVVLAVDATKEKVFWDAAGPRLASVKGDTTTGIWEATTGKQSRVIGKYWWGKEDVRPPGPRVAWSRDGRRLALGRADGFAIWDVAAGRMTLAVGAQTGPSGTLAWGPDDRHIAAAKADGSLTVWDAASGQALLKVPGRVKGRDFALPPPLAWSPDGKRLAAGAEGRTAKVWEAATGKELLTLRGHEDDVLALAWAPDGKRLASGGADSTVRVWDAASGQEVALLRGHRGPVQSLAWSPDGRRLASVGRDDGAAERPGILKLWDVATGQELAAWPRQVGPVMWSPDGRRLASVDGINETVTVRDATPPDEKP